MRIEFNQSSSRYHLLDLTELELEVLAEAAVQTDYVPVDGPTSRARDLLQVELRTELSRLVRRQQAVLVEAVAAERLEREADRTL